MDILSGKNFDGVRTTTMVVEAAKAKIVKIEAVRRGTTIKSLVDEIVSEWISKNVDKT